MTITLDDDLVSRARVEAAREGKSLSRFVSELVQRRVGRKKNQLEALQAFLDGPLLDLTDENGKAPSREELYDDAILRGHQRTDLYEGSQEQSETAHGDPVAHGNCKA